MELDHSWSDHRLVAGYWTATVSGSGVVLPDGFIDVMSIDGGPPFVAGPDRGPAAVTAPAGSKVVGLRLRDGVAPAAFAGDVSSLVDQRVPIADLWSAPDIRRLENDLGTAQNVDVFVSVLASEISRQAGPDWEPDPVVAGTARRLRCGQLRPATNLSARQQRRRFVATMGYGPKMFERICRLQRFLGMAEREPSRSLAQIAAWAGYFDEAHLARDTAQLAGSTPGQLR